MLKIGDHVKKVSGFKFRGHILAVFKARGHNGSWYAVVQLDKNKAADGLQHIYKLEQLEKIK